MIQFANRETLLCSGHCLPFIKEKLFFSVKGNFAKKGYLWSLVCYIAWRSVRTWWQVASSVLENFFENLCLSNSLFCGNMLQKIKSDRICATCYGNNILLQRQRFSQKFSVTHEVICRCDVSLQHVAATSHPTCTHVVICRHDLLLQLVT